MSFANGKGSRLIQLAISLLGILPLSVAAAQPPRLDGRLLVIPSEGILDGTMCLAHFEPRRVLRFLLGAPLNVKHVRDSGGRSIPYEGDIAGRMIGEARGYVIRQPDALPAFSKVCVEYRGAVPVFDTNSATADWKGRIVAFRGTVRAAEQACWYPTLFDSTTTATEDEVTYRMTVRCPACRSIYVNGSAAVADTAGVFESATPRSLLLYAGQISIRRTPVATFLGRAASDSTAAAFTSGIASIGGYYGGLLRIPYRETPALLSFESISQDCRHGQVNWQFVTWPTVTFSGGLDFGALVERDHGQARLPGGLWGALSHEMGHYYFGTIRYPHGPLFWFALESTAEYLSLKSIGAMRGEVALAQRLVDYLPELAPRYPALAEIADKDEISTSFRYRFAPMALLGLEHRVGEPRVMAMLRALLSAPSTETADYPALVRAAATAGISPEDLSASMSVDLVRTEVLANARRTLGSVEARADGDRAVRLAASLINVDTSVAGRLAVMAALGALVRADSARVAALYQIGKVGSLTGRELDAAQASLELYIKRSPADASPTHADAYWRLGTIAEHRGDRDKARAMYRAAIALNPAHAQSTQALARLGPAPADAPEVP
ncbi:MAG TPA: hypothetical protein VHE78_17170 [Gemmatimonadaceae bacterium]|nr:hypothetical protein [Gemmatimonadaceae bacterium]